MESNKIIERIENIEKEIFFLKNDRIKIQNLVNHYEKMFWLTNKEIEDKKEIIKELLKELQKINNKQK